MGKSRKDKNVKNEVLGRFKRFWVVSGLMWPFNKKTA